MIVAGIGCQKGATADQILTAVRATLVRDGVPKEKLTALASGEIKQGERGLHEAASRLGVPLRLMDLEALKATTGRTVTRSAKTEAIVGVPCLSEASALAAAGSGAHLLAPRLVHVPVTCALAVSGEAR